jgi:hypothetical protein
MRKTIVLCLKIIQSILMILSKKSSSVEKQRLALHLLNSASKTSIFASTNTFQEKASNKQTVEMEIIQRLPQLKVVIRSLFSLLVLSDDERIIGTLLFILIDLAIGEYGAYQIICDEENNEDNNNGINHENGENKTVTTTTITSSDQRKDNSSHGYANLPTSSTSTSQSQLLSLPLNKYNSSSKANIDLMTTKNNSCHTLFNIFIQKIQTRFYEERDGKNQSNLWSLIDLTVQFIIILHKIVIEKFESKYYLFKRFITQKIITTIPNQMQMNSQNQIQQQQQQQQQQRSTILQTLIDLIKVTNIQKRDV